MHAAVAEDELADAEVPAAEFLSCRVFDGSGETKPGHPRGATMAIEIEAVVNGAVPFSLGELVQRHVLVADHKRVAHAVGNFAPANSLAIHANPKDPRGRSQPLGDVIVAGGADTSGIVAERAGLPAE